MDIDATRIRVAYMFGHAAHADWVFMDDNPFDRWRNHELWRAWLDGWLDAEWDAMHGWHLIRGAM